MAQAAAGAEALAEARDAWLELGRPLDAARCVLLRGTRLRDVNAEAAATALRGAAATFEELGVRHLAERARELVPDLSGSARPVPRRGYCLVTSLPGPPSRTSTPGSAAQAIASLLAPQLIVAGRRRRGGRFRCAPRIVSSPPLPLTTSLPPPAQITSSPGVPTRWSRPGVPEIVQSPAPDAGDRVRGRRRASSPGAGRSRR